MTVIRDDRARPDAVSLQSGRWCSHSTATGLAFLTVRSAVLDNVVGSFTAEGLQGLTAGQRALTMLGVVPEWVRLFVWPAHLQADYSPQEINGALDWGAAQTLGLFILAAAVIGALAARRTAPVATFGVLWIGIALFPGQQRAGADGNRARRADALSRRASASCSRSAPCCPPCLPRGRRARARSVAAAVAALILVLVAGAVASARRQRTWANPFAQSAQLLIDAPLSYRSHYGAASLLWEGHQREAPRSSTTARWRSSRAASRCRGNWRTGCGSRPAAPKRFPCTSRRCAMHPTSMRCARPTSPA